LCEDVLYNSVSTSPSPYPVYLTDISRTGTLVTAVCAGGHPFQVGSLVNISGTNMTGTSCITGTLAGGALNLLGPYSVTSVSGTQFQYNTTTSGNLVINVGGGASPVNSSNPQGYAVLAVAPTSAIKINVSDVVLDLGCHELTQSNTATSNVWAIEVAPGVNNVMIIGGAIKNFSGGAIRFEKNHSNVMIQGVTTYNVGYLGALTLIQPVAQNSANHWNSAICFNSSNGSNAAGAVTPTNFPSANIDIRDCKFFNTGTLESRVFIGSSGLFTALNGANNVAAILCSGVSQLNISNCLVDGMYGSLNSWGLHYISDSSSVTISDCVTSNILSSRLTKGAWTRRVTTLDMKDCTFTSILSELLSSSLANAGAPGAEGVKIEATDVKYQRCNWGNVRTVITNTPPVWPLSVGWNNYAVQLPAGGFALLEDCVAQRIIVDRNFQTTAENTIGGFPSNGAQFAKSTIYKNCKVSDVESPIGPISGFFRRALESIAVDVPSPGSNVALPVTNIYRNCTADNLFITSNVSGTNAYAAGFVALGERIKIEDCEATNIISGNVGANAYGIRLLTSSANTFVINSRVIGCTTSGISLQTPQLASHQITLSGNFASLNGTGAVTPAPFSNYENVNVSLIPVQDWSVNGLPGAVVSSATHDNMDRHV